MKRKFNIGIVDVKDGSYKDFSEKDVTTSTTSGWFSSSE